MQWTGRERVFIGTDPKINRVVCRMRSDGVMYCISNCKADGREDSIWPQLLNDETKCRAVGDEGFDAEFEAQMLRCNGTEEE